MRVVQRTTDFEGHGRGMAAYLLPGPLPVGREQYENGCDHARVAQTAVNFDLGPIDAIPAKDVDRAILRHGEAPHRWVDGDGNRRQVSG